MSQLQQPPQQQQQLAQYEIDDEEEERGVDHEELQEAEFGEVADAVGDVQRPIQVRRQSAGNVWRVYLLMFWHCHAGNLPTNTRLANYGC